MQDILFTNEYLNEYQNFSEHHWKYSINKLAFKSTVIASVVCIIIAQINVSHPVLSDAPDRIKISFLTPMQIGFVWLLDGNVYKT